MKDSFSVLNMFTGRGTNYSAVNTSDGNENIYTPTTASSQPNDTSHRKSQSLNPSVAVFDRFFQGHFGQSHQRKNCKRNNVSLLFLKYCVTLLSTILSKPIFKTGQLSLKVKNNTEINK